MPLSYSRNPLKSLSACLGVSLVPYRTSELS